MGREPGGVGVTRIEWTCRIEGQADDPRTRVMRMEIPRQMNALDAAQWIARQFEVDLRRQLEAMQGVVGALGAERLRWGPNVLEDARIDGVWLDELAPRNRTVAETQAEMDRIVERLNRGDYQQDPLSRRPAPRTSHSTW